ncbi:MAG: hypothetical protein ACLP7J_19050 [Streptosporangiaceae bacterium]
MRVALLMLTLAGAGIDTGNAHAVGQQLRAALADSTAVVARPLAR